MGRFPESYSCAGSRHPFVRKVHRKAGRKIAGYIGISVGAVWRCGFCSVRGRPFGRAYHKEKQGIGNKRVLPTLAQPVSPTVGNGAGLPPVIRTIRYTAVKGTSGFSNLFF